MDLEPDILRNKKKHIDICNELKFSNKTYLECVNLKHVALSELSFDEIDTSITFLNYKLKMPYFISPMTGGDKRGNILNKTLVQIANKLQIPIGLGSYKLLFKYPQYITDFRLKKYAPLVPLFSNISAVQVRELGEDKIVEMGKVLEVDAQTVHLNWGQELLNSYGERDFRNIKHSIEKLSKKSKLPIIVKETGFGISHVEVKTLLELGVAYVDLAGSGGTNWILVEGVKEQKQSIASNFLDWGIPAVFTLLSLDTCYKEKVFASGGFKKGIELVKGLALGAKMVGMGNVILNTLCKQGEAALYQLFEDYHYALKIAMLMSQSRTIVDLQKNKYFTSKQLLNEVVNYRDIYDFQKG